MFQNIIEQLPHNFVELIDYIVIYVIFRGIFSKWLGNKLIDTVFAPLGKFMKKRLIKTERDVAIWMHYKNKAMNKGHNHDDPFICDDGKCILL